MTNHEVPEGVALPAQTPHSPGLAVLMAPLNLARVAKRQGCSTSRRLSRPPDPTVRLWWVLGEVIQSEIPLPGTGPQATNKTR